MSIAVTCPSCAAKFSVKDESAGKRGKCPKCGEPITVPGGASAPTPARPVAARPRPADDEDDAPKPKRRRDDDEDDAPRSKRRDDADDDRSKAKKRRNADDEEDDRPKGNRRRSGDAPKKKGKLPLLLGILGGLLVLCAGCGGAFFFWFLPELQSAARRMTESSRKQQEVDKNDKVKQENLDRIRKGMTLAQVEEVLGPAQIPPRDQMTMLFNDPQHGVDILEPWVEAYQAGRVRGWLNQPSRIFVAFSADPSAGGTVIGVVARFGASGITTDPIELTGVKPAAADVSLASAKRVSQGMTQRQVDEVLGGPGTAGNKFATDEAIAAMEGDTKAVGERWHTATMEGRVFVWSKGADKVLVAYNSQPGARGGTVSGVIGLFDGEARELLPLGGAK